MGQSASQAAAFYRQVAETGLVYTIFDSGGYPAPLKSDGRRAHPFWSSASRIRRVQKACPTYAVFEIEEVGWVDFIDRFLPALEKASLLVGVNWSGKNATGYHLEPGDVVRNVQHFRQDIDAT